MIGTYFKQIFGMLLLSGFIGFLGYKFFLSFGHADFVVEITLIAIVILIFILLAIRRILRGY